MLKSIALMVLWAILATSPKAWAAHFDIVYAKYSDKPDPREGLPLAALDLAMKKTNSTYTIRSSDQKMERSRAIIVGSAPARHASTRRWMAVSVAGRFTDWAMVTS